MRDVFAQRRAVALLLSTVTLCWGASRATAQDQAQPNPRVQQQLDKLKKGVEQKLGHDETGFFVVALSTT